LTNGISFHSGEAEIKKYRDQGRLTFLATLHQAASCPIALLFATHVRLKDEPARLLEN